MDLEQKFNWKIQKLERACTEGASDTGVRLQLAEAYFQKGYYLGKGEHWFDLTLERVDEVLAAGAEGLSSAAWTLRGNALAGKGAWDEAERAYRRSLEEDASNALALVGLGNLERRRRDWRRAREFFARATELAPNLWQAHYNLGRAAHEEAQSKDLRAAEGLLERAVYHLVCALRLEPVETFVPNIYKELGELFLYSRRYEDAKKFFTRLTRHERYAPLAWYYLGLTNYSLGKYKSAIASFRTFLKHEPDNALAWAKIGLAHLELSEGTRAREACEKALSIDPDNILALFTLGCSWLDEGDHARGDRYLEEVLSRDPQYFPAFAELVKSHLTAQDELWLFERLEAEVTRFEAHDGYEGGRGCYVGPRGPTRRRIEVLLATLREVGARAFPSLLRQLDRVQTDSLRFQIWEELYELALTSHVDGVRRRLEDAGRLFSEELGREALRVSQYLPASALVDAFHVEDEALRRRALERLERRDDIGAYKERLAEVRGELLVFQGYLLRAMAVKGTEDAERFLTEALESPDRVLRLSAAVALVYYGNERALECLEEEAARLEGSVVGALKALIRTGWERHGERHKIIHLKDLMDTDRGAEPVPLTQSRPRLKARAASNHCSVCHKDQREVERMLAGSQLMICIGCVKETAGQKATFREADGSADRCSFCRRSALEVDALYTRQVVGKTDRVHICDQCLDLATGVLQKEEVERFLREFQ